MDHAQAVISSNRRIRALAQGIEKLCEKPIALSRAELGFRILPLSEATARLAHLEGLHAKYTRLEVELKVASTVFGNVSKSLLRGSESELEFLAAEVLIATREVQVSTMDVQIQEMDDEIAILREQQALGWPKARANAAARARRSDSSNKQINTVGIPESDLEFAELMMTAEALEEDAVKDDNE